MEASEKTVVSIDERRTANSQFETVSQGKLNANRENAKKSTGPRTPRGKAYSRKNAIKHGLFTQCWQDFTLQGESQEDYDRLLDGLHQQFEPLGRAEELEVERMVVSWWRLHRAWRYENSENLGSVSREIGELEQLERSYKRADEEREAIILGLQKMIDELSVASEVPPDLKDRFFVLTSTKEQNWKLFEDTAEEVLKQKEPELERSAGSLWTPECRRKALVHTTLVAAVASYKNMPRSAQQNVKLKLSQHVIPNRDALDKILRYETTSERSLDRAINRLDRLQRRRKGELILPPVDVHLS